MYKGPQMYYQKKNEIAMRYYSYVCKGPETGEKEENEVAKHYHRKKGLYKWYTISEFKKHVLTMFGEAEKGIVEFQLFGDHPLTPKVSPKQFEYLLQKTHEQIILHVGRNKIEDKLIPYSGPQCHEDREEEGRMEYTGLRRRNRTVQKRALVLELHKKCNTCKSNIRCIRCSANHMTRSVLF